MQLRAPAMMAMSGPVLMDHCIGITGDRIRYILPVSEAPRDPDVIDLPHTTLLPGFVNAHCHMDLSHLRGKVRFGGSFTEWIREIMTLRQHLTADAVQTASQELLRSGVTRVLDHVGIQSELAYIIDTPFQKNLFLEVIGVTKEAAMASLHIQNGRAAEARRHGILAIPSPHAPYSLHPEVFENLAEGGGGLSIHCAESAEEWEKFTGEYHSPLHYLAKNNLLPRYPWFAVHCNTLTDDDITLLKKSHATVVHCPRSHRYFNHPPFPLDRLRAAGVPIAIGTDSLASCPNFDFMEELRAMREAFPSLKADDILQMACLTPTLHPALKALSAGQADIIGLRCQNDILQGPVTFSMIGGRRVI